MREVVVISGKGGTGKTTIVASFAALARNKVMVDCDVDAADLHLLLHPAVKESNEFWSGGYSVIDPEACIQCGLCEELCRFGAIKDFVVDPVACEGCGFCRNVCPVDAVSMKERLSGHWFRSETRYGPLVHAKLGVAQENSGRLVTLVRQEASKTAEQRGSDLILSDGPPGIGCPVIASLSGVDVALVVTEPTLSGIHDMERIVSLCRHFNVPALVCVNKYDINEENTRRIEEGCQEAGVAVVSRIPYDPTVVEALAKGLPVVEYAQNGVARSIMELWGSVLESLGK